jgi:hypothetical protein
MKKHFSNQQCFKEKNIILNFQSVNLILKKIKSTNIILKNRKTIWENTIAIHSILKEKNYKAKFLTKLILKK